MNQASTSHNPYHSPSASLENHSETQKPKPRRPISVWIMQVLLLTFAALIVFGIYSGFRRGLNLSYIKEHLLEFIVRWLFVIATLCAIVLTQRGLHKAKKWSRWVAVGLLLLLLLSSIFQADKNVYSNDAERTGAMMARYILIPAIFTWWIFAIAFTRKARAYFSSEDQSKI